MLGWLGVERVGLKQASGAEMFIGHFWRGKTRFLVVVVACLVMLCGNAFAESLEAALAYTYQNNPQLNAQRALVRATDENVSQALSGYRPKISVNGSAGIQSLSTTIKNVGSTIPLNTPATYFTQSGENAPYGAGTTITQTLYNGFQTANKTRQAESQVFAARETLRNMEQTVLLNAATAYMNLSRDAAIFELQKRNVQVLEDQLKQTRQRLDAGNVTATDVYQAESRLAAGRIQMFAAEANYNTSRAVYRQAIGLEPGKLSAASPVDRFIPNNRDTAVAVGTAQNPTVSAAQYSVDVALQQVKVAESSLSPTVSLQGNVQQNNSSALATYQSFSASLLGQITVPIYQGGSEYSLIRQAKETLGQQRLNLDYTRDQARVGVLQYWAQTEASKQSLQMAIQQVKETESALNGVSEEARLGQRTTLDVLNAQQELVGARVSLITAQRDRIVNSYSLLAAIGHLSPQVLGLNVPAYDTQVHYQQVRDAWFGVRNPDGR
jgi:outer membrane protein